MALDFIAGCVGGSAGVIVGHPLDTVKVHLQVQNANSHVKYSGTFHCLKSLVAKEGVKGVFRGVTSPLVGIAAINAIVFGVYGNCQKSFKDPNSLTSVTIAGGVAGLVQSFICSPIELAKSRMQVSNKYSGPLDCIRQIYANEGTRGVFRGLNITIVREVPAFGVYFLAYEILTRSNEPVSTLNMLVAGGFAGVASWGSIYPIDVIKSRMQLDGMSSQSIYKNSFDCLRKSVQADGYICLFRGLTPTLIRAFPVNAVTFTVVEWTMKLLSGDIKLPGTVKETESILERCTDAVYALKMTESASG